MNNLKRERWSSKIGIILAVAGSAVGLGNFLRFPSKVASYGGGAFMIPYFISLFLLGIPLMWIEWTLGRYGGGFEHGTAPGIFHSVWRKNRFIKYFGVIGIFGPLVIFIYYVYIESWTLAYSFFSLFGKYVNIQNQEVMKKFLNGFLGLENNQFFNSITTAYIFFLITFVLNVFVAYKGIRGGIEKLCKLAMPSLFIFSIILVIRVFLLGSPNPENPNLNPINGLGFLWNPNLSLLKSPRVWLEAAGQIFFTLSVGIGVILTYASYLSEAEDVALSGLTAVSTNEMAEVILGGSLIIPAAFTFFGPIETKNIASSGVFNLAFVTMPLILNKLPLNFIFGFLWFFLLFLAGITSSISLAQPAIAFLEDEFDLDRKKAVIIFSILTFILCQFSIFFFKNGIIDELDFWGGTFCLVLFAMVETILFGWIFGIDKAWDEMHKGAEIRIPKIYKFIIKYITPIFLLFILGMWLFYVPEGATESEFVSFIRMINTPNQNKIFVILTRVILVLIFIVLSILVKIAWKKKRDNFVLN